MGQLSLTHILLFLIIVLVFFGPSRLPGLGKSLGEAIRGFKKGLEGGDEAKPSQAGAPQPPPVEQQQHLASRHVSPLELQQQQGSEHVPHYSTNKTDNRS